MLTISGLPVENNIKNFIKVYVKPAYGNKFMSKLHMETSTRECLFVLRFYGPVNPMGSCRARSVYLTTRLLGRLSPLSG